MYNALNETQIIKENMIKYLIPPPNFVHTVSVLESRRRYQKEK